MWSRRSTKTSSATQSMICHHEKLSSEYQAPRRDSIVGLLRRPMREEPLLLEGTSWIDAELSDSLMLSESQHCLVLLGVGTYERGEEIGDLKETRLRGILEDPSLSQNFVRLAEVSVHVDDDSE